ncbi:MAG: hypothetical protein E4H01_00110 [Lysobacterales bacterium]|nr:MAG: hypothetical protein E4H01_00110 [Xanthomonadales bacterium]
MTVTERADHEANYYSSIYVRGYVLTRSRYEDDWAMNKRIHFGVSDNGGDRKYDYRWSGENKDQTSTLQEEMILGLPAPASHYLQGGHLRVLFDERN